MRIHLIGACGTAMGTLAAAGALVFGEFPGCDEPANGLSIKDVIRDFVQGFPGPVLFGFPFGHTKGPSWTLPIGVRARVTSAPPAIVVEEPAVR